jgi:hypothetical protein
MVKLSPMFNKIFLAVFALAVLAMSVLTYTANSWLDRSGFSPAIIVSTFEYWMNLHWSALWISSLVLLILANVILWSYRKSWAIWLSFLYFGVFLMLNTWWLSDAIIGYKKANNLFDGSFSVSGIVGAFLCVFVGIGVVFNHFIVLKLSAKMFGTASDKTKSVAEPVVTESE